MGLRKYRTFPAGYLNRLCEKMNRAAQMLDDDAESLKLSHTIDGEWRDEESARAEYDKIKEVVRALRDYCLDLCPSRSPSARHPE